MKMVARRSALCCSPNSEDGIPIDRGWAWVIALACAGLLCLIAGTFKCFGILKLKIEEEFPEFGPDNTLWVLSACSIVSLLAGPFFSFLVNKTSHRVVGMIGGFLCSSGLLASAYAPNGYFLLFSFSCVYSVGTGGIMVVVFSAFADYFSKHRGLAIGVVASGSGFGGLVIPKLFGYLFDRLTFNGALTVYAAIYLQSMVLAALLRPVSYYNNRGLAKSDSSDKSNQTISTDEEHDLLSKQIPIKEDSYEDSCDSTQSSSSSSITKEKLIIEELHPLNELPIETDNNNKAPLLLTSQDTRAPEYTQQIFGSIYSSLASPFVSTLSLNELAYTSKQPTTELNNVTTKTSSSAVAPINRMTISFYNSCRLWVIPQVLLIGALLFFAVNSINLIFTTTPSFAKEKGVDEHTVTTIMTVTGCTEVGFRIMHGWIADRRIFSALTQIFIIMLLCTIASVLSATLPGLPGTAIMYTAMSLCGTTIFSLLPILIIEQVGKDCLVTVLGIFNVYQAFAFIVSTLVANFLQKAFHSLLGVFFYVSACYLIASAIAAAILIYKKVAEKRERSKSETMPVVVALI